MSEPDITAPLAPPLLFDALLTPHRSLSRRGFIILMALVSGVSFMAGLAFLALGAWPVLGFFGLDVALIYGAFRLNYRAGRLHETVQLSPRDLRVRRIAPNGQTQAWNFQPYWTRIFTETEPGNDVSIYLGSHGRRVRIGAFLAAGERREFARALDAALAGLKAP